MRRRKRIGLAALGLLGLLLLGAAVPVATVEIGCGRGEAFHSATAEPLVADAGYRRAEGDSFMTFPEWDIVYAYADLADVTRQSSESSYGYGQAIDAYWSSLCRATATARATGPVTADQRVTDYIIGLSFTLEMVLQGAYEETVGAATAWLRGPEKTSEDAFNQRFLDDYAAFLHQTPWYRYPFAAEFTRFWSETPWSFRAPVRSVERRFALSLEYGFKALYAIAIGALAGYSPADLSIMTVIEGGEGATVAGVTLVRDLGGGRSLVRTQRYEAYSRILEAWAATGTTVLEIAGNRRILLTVVVPGSATPTLPQSTPIFAMPLQSRPGSRRIGLDTQVPAIGAVIRAATSQGVTFEHAYDY